MVRQDNKLTADDKGWRRTVTSAGARTIFISSVLFLLTVGTFWQLQDNGFVAFDDTDYILGNPNVQAGLTMNGVRWAFTTGHMGNWHPLTWLSHMLDCELFGLNAAGHHLMSLFFHTLNAILLFLVFRNMTGLPAGGRFGPQAGSVWPSAFVATVFALHPLHVESVAWIAERKDVLSTLFWILTMWAYVRYIDRPVTKRFLLVILFMGLGLMAKPMLVTLPFVLLLLDYWPLQRFKHQLPTKQRGGAGRSEIKYHTYKLVREKWPLFVLVSASSFITVVVQRQAGAVQDWASMNLGVRMGNALVSYVKYMELSVWPSGLAVLYPHPLEGLSILEIGGALTVLIAITYGVLRMVRRLPYLFVGWLWFLGTLVPVIGIVQVGSQAMADRYMYVPLIGLSIAVAWGMSDLVRSWRPARTLLMVAGTLATVGMVWGSSTQLSHWRDTGSLYRRAITATTGNWLLLNNLGALVEGEGRIAEASDYYWRSVQFNPGYAKARYNLGNALAKQGKIGDAMEQYAEAVRLDPRFVDTYLNWAFYLSEIGKLDESVSKYQQGLRIAPGNATAHYFLARTLLRQGRTLAAITHLQHALRINPGYTEARVALQSATQETAR